MKGIEIVFNNWSIASNNQTYTRQYDNLSAALIVAGEIPDGWTWDMLVEAKENLNIIRLTEMEDGVGTILTDEMLAISGYYTMQLRGTQGEIVKHTNKIQVFVPDSLSGNVQWPIIPSEFSQLEARVNADSDRAEDAAQAAEDAASHQPYPNPDTGTWWTWDAETGAYKDTGEPYSGGGSGEAGQDGGYYAPSVDDDGNLTWTPSKADMPPVEDANIKGPAGQTGATPNLQIGEVTTLDAGSDATASITGTPENPLLNLGIPKGADGAGGSGGFGLPLLYDLTTEQEVRWINTGDNAFFANYFIIIELISVATETNSQDFSGCCSIYPTKQNACPWDNYAVAKFVSALLPRDSTRVFRAFCFRGADGDWTSVYSIRTQVNDSANNASMKTSANDGITNQPMRGIIIGDASAASGTRVLGIGSQLKVWGI